jgi:alpha-tubulin suppressor-like RCC1 family protein
MTTGGVKCWGDNSYGQLGDGTQNNSPVPIDVPGMTSEITAIAAGGSTTCAIQSAGRVYCWGDNYTGQIGDGSTAEMRTTPTRVVTLPDGANSISVGWGHVCAGLPPGIQCWGNNLHGGLGDGKAGYSTTPLDVIWLAYRTYMPVARK